MKHNMSKTHNVLIVGGGSACLALIKLFRQNDSVKIVAVVDEDLSAPGIKLAQENNIPVAETWGCFLSDGTIHEVINATGSSEVHQQLLKNKPPNAVVMGDAMAQSVWFLAKEYELVEQKIQEAKEDVEAHEWGVQKTNEAIKTLYAELEKKNKELEKLDQLKSDFIATVSHELRTPMAITKEGISLILDGALGHVSEKQTRVLSTARDSIDRLSRLINNLLDISKIESGKEEVKKSLISLTETVQQAVAFFESKVSKKGLSIRANVPAKDIEIYGDHDKILQVFTNLLNNAIKFTDQGGIVLHLEEKDNEIECSVEDTGKGVPQDQIAKMFVKFQQIDRVHGDGEKGTGLGLNIVQGIVRLHGGTIWAESEVDRGTKILFTLPKLSEQNVLREYVDKGMGEAEQHANKMSLIMVGVKQSSNGKEKLSQAKIVTVLKQIDGILKSNLDHAGGTALKEARECIIILPNSSKETALSAEGRLKQAIDDYLTRERLTDQISLRFGCATYPDEARNSEELIKLASTNNS